LGVNLQDVVRNPGDEGAMEAPEEFHSEAFAVEPPFVIADKSPEPFVLLLVLRMGRTPETFHALLLALEMNLGIGFQVLHQVNHEFQLRHPGIGGMQVFFQQIDKFNQQPVLLVQVRGTGLKLFCPNYHTV
jgi:hypothetical protein